MSKIICYNKMINNDLKTLAKLDRMREQVEKEIEKKQAKVKEFENKKAERDARPKRVRKPKKIEDIIKKDEKLDEKIVQNQEEIKEELKEIKKEPKLEIVNNPNLVETIKDENIYKRTKQEIMANARSKKGRPKKIEKVGNLEYVTKKKEDEFIEI